MIKLKQQIKDNKSEEELIKAIQKISNCEHGAYTLYLCDSRPNRSLAQNRYLWGVVYRTLADELGYETEQVHEYCKKRFGLTTKFDIKQGEHVPIHNRPEAYALNGDICDMCGAECLSAKKGEDIIAVCTNADCELEWKITQDGEMELYYNPVDVVEFAKSTKFFDTKEMTEYIDKIIRFSIDELNINIPEPGQLSEDQYVQAMHTKY